MTLASRNYIIAATPRTGSNLLCEGLSAALLAGFPAEFFAPDFRGYWYKRLGLRSETSFADFLKSVLQLGTTPNGIFGTKIQWMHVAVLASNSCHCGLPESVLESLFPGASYINIIRRDRRAQALSWFRACCTNEWFRTGPVRSQRVEPPDLDIERVLYLEWHIGQQQSSWQRYFAQRGIRPLVLEYECLENDYRGQIGRALAFLGLDVSAAQTVPDPALTRQSDEVTTVWRKVMDAAYPQ